MNSLKTKIKFLIFPSIFFGAVFFSNYLFAYDEIKVHPGLSEEMAKLYNENYPDNKLTAEEVVSIRKGSTDEDDSVLLAIRSSNHFYNPLGVKGWIDDTAKKEIVPTSGMISKAWAHDSARQETFPGGDFTWERAIKDYASGDKSRAYEGLGHILHLLEDATVPAHVRSDLHISPKEFEAKKDTELGKFFLDYEPYESWTGKEAALDRLNFDFSKNLIAENKKPVIRQNIDEYFDGLAFYTNKGFFSKDTIYSYSEPNNKIIEGSEKVSNGDIVKYVYGFDEYGQKFKLAEIPKNIDIEQKGYIIDDTTPEIHSDYWSRLGSKGVLEGAGVIKLFKDEAEKAAKNFKVADQSWLSKNVSKYSYIIYRGIMEGGSTIVQNEVTLGTLLGNIVVYTGNQITQTVKSSVTTAYGVAKSAATTAYGVGKSAAVGAYDATKSAAASAYNTAKTTTVTVFNKTKTGLGLAKEYMISSAIKIGDFFDSGINSASKYFTSFAGTAKASLEFDMTKPLIGSYSVEQILEQIKVVEKVQAATIDVPVYGAELAALKGQKATFTPGEEISLSAEIKNIGSIEWEGENISLNVYVEMDLAQKFYHSSWLTAVRPASLGKIKIVPGETGTFNFIVIAPQTAGDYFFRVRAVRQDGNNFNWLGEDIASWAIRVQTPEILITEEKPADPPIGNKEQISGAGNSDEEVSAAGNNLPPEEIVPAADGNTGKEKIGEEAPVAVNAANLEAEEAARLEEETAQRRRRARAWAATVPETTIIGSPEKITAETTAGFKFSSSKGGTVFSCSLDGSEFADCGEITIFEKLASGGHILQVKAKDEYGNIDETPAEYGWTIEKLLHPVISELQTGGATADDEFVEIYNPAKTAVDLSGWSIQYRGGEAAGYYKKNFGSGDMIPAQGYFLVARKDKYAGIIAPDMTWGVALSGDGGTVFLSGGDVLLSGETDMGEAVVDRIAWGQGKEKYLRGETKEFLPAPLSGQSLERKANAGSTAESLARGADKYLGNEWDTDDNSEDFVLRVVPDPQNSKSPAEPRYAPEKIGDLSAAGIERDSRAVKLTWSAPDGANGANENLIYDIRFSDSEIMSENFNSANIAPDIPAVKKKGEVQELEIKDLTLDKTYYFAIKTSDNTGLESAIAFAQYSFLSAQDLSPWPAYKGNNQHTGQSAYNGPQTASLKWKYKTGGWVINSPSISGDGNIYLWSHEGAESYGNLAALDPDGSLEWKQPSPFFMNTPVLDSEGNIIFAFHQVIHKNNWRDGNPLTSYWIQDSYYGSAALSSVLAARDGTVYFASKETMGWIYAADRDLKIKWKKQLGGVIWAGPSEDKAGNIYTNTVITAVKADPETGGDVFDKENSFFRLFSFDKNGNERWRNDLVGVDNIYGTSGFFSPALGDGAGYVAAKNSLYAFDPDSGTVKWSYAFTDSNNSGGSPSLAGDGTIYIVSSDGYLYAIGSEGAEKWKFRIADDLNSWAWANFYYISTPAIGADGTVYVGGENIFYAINSDGTEKWSYSMSVDSPGQVAYGGTPAVGKNGIVYVSFSGINGAMLYAFGDN